MDLISVVIGLAVGLGVYFVWNLLDKRRNSQLYSLFSTLKKKNPIIFLETDKACYFRTIARTFKNIAITPEKDIIVMPRSSPKPCLDLGGAQIIHADLYKGIATPREFRLFIDQLVNDGWTEEQIASFFQTIETVPPEEVTKYFYEQDEAKKKSKKAGKETEDTDVDLPLKKKLNIYKSLPSIVKDYIYSGINRTSIHAMLRELVFQRELEKIGGRPWLTYAIVILIVAVAIGLLFRFVFSTPGITSMIAGATSTPPAQIAP